MACLVYREAAGISTATVFKDGAGRAIGTKGFGTWRMDVGRRRRAGPGGADGPEDSERE